MHRYAALLLLAALASRASAYPPVTAAQLGQLLAAAHGRSDAEMARQLADLQLTERLSASRFSRLQLQLPGNASRQALLAIGDASAFLSLPAEEIPPTVAPNLAAQRRMMALTVDYVARTIHQLPNLYTTRMTSSFEDEPWRFEKSQSSPGSQQAHPAIVSLRPLHFVGADRATVLYRKGEEVVKAEASGSQSSAHGLTTSGEFGPILGTAMLDAARSKLGWSHWEQAASGQIAVYRYAVPADKSHYQVKYCCIVRDAGDRIYFEQSVAYQGEIAVDPASGAIMRITLQAELKLTDPLVRADIAVEYGPVDIGGKIYICPIKGVALSVGLAFHAYRQGAEEALRPLQTSLNDIAFNQYHAFRAEARMLSADKDPLSSNPASVASAQVAVVPSPNLVQEPPIAAENVQPIAATASTPSPGPVAAPESAEIIVGTGTVPDLTNPSSKVPSAQVENFTLRVTTRLVDVGVVALDKKGHAVSDLKVEDFEIYDDGRKQEIRSFRKAGETAAVDSPTSSTTPAFFNRRAALTDGRPSAEQGSVTVLLIDGSNLAWGDLTYARAEIVRCVRALSPDDRVALYVMKAHGFQVLEEGTMDHALLLSRLAQWMPSAQDLAQAQAEEQHNRQRFEEVRNLADLQSVNGNSSSAPDSAAPIDPQLRNEGGNAGRGALVILTGVARHLAAIPGHKNLLWITSDNVLANWTDKALSSDKGVKQIDSMVLRVQEAINDADASIYPLDASQLEPSTVDASIRNQSVELAPGSMDRAPRDTRPGRLTAEMEQDTHPVQAAIVGMAEATGGRVFRRAGDMAAELNGVVADGRATYLLGFTPGAPADDTYHLLSVKVSGRRGITLRYRTGYQYARLPATRAERLREALWQPLDANDIAVTANPVKSAAGTTLMLNISTRDVALKQQDDRWGDTLEIFALQTNDGLHAHIEAKTLKLALKPATYQSLLNKGISFEQLVKPDENASSVRILVLDENSGLMGSITVPAALLQVTH